eukprot:TRINITY_DN1646_c1_g3_i1.p1 TRINITY_DN1646_c1_g3~~TRINITY_DN1646_c1_g3_i1.p1  ORF type:complete len:371 (+),score=71.85 TRINITY_DN1646_c1_g3_i1:34-1146(+)
MKGAKKKGGRGGGGGGKREKKKKMNYFPESHRTPLAKEQWVEVGCASRERLQGSGSDSILKTETSLEEEGGLVGKYWEGEGSYSVLIVGRRNTEVWACNETEMSVDQTVKTKLRHLSINYKAICSVISEGLGTVCKATCVDSDIKLSIETSLRLTSSGATVPLAWEMTLSKLPPHEGVKIISELLVQPLTGVVSALAYCKNLFHQTLLAKDRELKAYYDAFGPVPGQTKHTPAFKPDSYYEELLKSPELLHALRNGGLTPLGGGDIAPSLYSLYTGGPAVREPCPAKEEENLILVTPPHEKTPENFLFTDGGIDGDPSPPLKKARQASYVESEDETRRREELTQKLQLKTSPEKKTGEKAMKKKLKNIFK